MKLGLLLLIGITLLIIGYVSFKVFYNNQKSTPQILNKTIIEQLFNRTAEEFSDEGVVKVSLPRTDIKVTVQGWPLDPFMGVTTWFAFQKGKKPGIEAMVMGDVVLQEHEVNPAISAALEHNIQ